MNTPLLFVRHHIIGGAPPNFLQELAATQRAQVVDVSPTNSSCRGTFKGLFDTGQNVALMRTVLVRAERDRLVKTAHAAGGAYIVRLVIQTDLEVAQERIVAEAQLEPDNASRSAVSDLRSRLVLASSQLDSIEWPGPAEPHLILDGSQPAVDMLQDVEVYVDSLGEQPPAATYGY